MSTQTKEVRSMTPEQIHQVRVRCAEIDGWKLHEGCAFLCSSTRGDKAWGFPDYCNSIDAINAAVLRLDEGDMLRWQDSLCDITGYGDEPHEMMAKIITASALDRARAFVQIHE